MMFVSCAQESALLLTKLDNAHAIPVLCRFLSITLFNVFAQITGSRVVIHAFSAIEVRYLSKSFIFHVSRFTG